MLGGSVQGGKQFARITSLVLKPASNDNLFKQVPTLKKFYFGV